MFLDNKKNKDIILIVSAVIWFILFICGIVLIHNILLVIIYQSIMIVSLFVIWLYWYMRYDGA